MTTRMTDKDYEDAASLKPDAISKLIRSMTLLPDPYTNPFPVYAGGGLNSVRAPKPETGDEHSA